MPSFRPKDFIAIVLLTIFIGLKIAGFDGTVDGGFLLIVGYYFAHRQDGIDNGK